jgi:hypothetical protein
VRRVRGSGRARRPELPPAVLLTRPARWLDQVWGGGRDAWNDPRARELMTLYRANIAAFRRGE